MAMEPAFSARIALDAKDKGGAIDIAFSTIDPVPVFFNTNAILRDAPHPNAAKLFLNFYLSNEQQIANGTWSARRGVPPPHGMQPLSAYQLANGYRAFMVQTGLVDDLRPPGTMGTAAPWVPLPDDWRLERG
jgi:ABC-type Fe3+ transport system substrate-binding protein